QKLAAASLAINGAPSMQRMLQSITDAARDIIGTHQAITLYITDGGLARAEAPRTTTLTSFSPKYAEWRGRVLALDRCAETAIGRSLHPVRLTRSELVEHPDWEVVGPLVDAGELPPIAGMMSAPLIGQDGRRMGIVYVSEKMEPATATAFTADEEAILVQLTQMASIAIENHLFSQEREANRLKDEFLATLSHELRTPLNAILGWTQLLRTEELVGDVARGVEVIDRNARSQTKLIEDLLDVSRITTGKLRLATRPIPLGPVVAAAVDAVRPAAAAKQVAIIMPEDYPEDRISGDPDRLQQVVWNLLSNAVKFTNPGGRVSVTAARDGDRMTVAVADDGQGIDPKFLPHVFDRFRQADSTSTRSHGGLGIGLTIARHILELHGGTVRADSDGLGRGATFTIEVPVLAAADATDAAPNGNRYAAGGNGKLAAHAADDDVSVAGEADRALQPSDRLAGVTVLVVDDEPDARDVLLQILRRADATVTTAASAPEALSRLRAGRVDVLVSDIAMPGMDGYELITAVRADGSAAVRDVPAISLTAYAREDDRARCLTAGFNVHLPKPVDPAHLLTAIADLVPRAAVVTR
ncbi:MAG TPA: ATP-binding protein, partial [Tepidisphaeraceae bacterium]|nr:ATP-binding protein [Tepidisphaeraceae bacterium]